ncbi:carboxymuconolactone decarboxylase family protein [Streptomyces sp. NPDC087440]|uniref:carboxymuconolactone decarboxylase family protein n=1 Tax=Streptomyces sp. NPDC087440 TaxID=3365790 RepID=UPI00380F7E80
MTNTPFRFTSPAAPSSATGTTAAVYRQVLDDFGVPYPPTFVVLSPSPELLTSFWALMREALLAGEAGHTEKELVATGVSLANGCGFCTNAHLFLLHANGEHALARRIDEGRTPDDPAHAQLLGWGRDIGSKPPFPADHPHAEEFIGSALAFHFMNRVADTLLAPQERDSDARRLRLLDSDAGRHISAVARRTLTPAASLPLLRSSGEAPPWAAPGSPVAVAYGALRAAGELGAGLLAEDDAAYVRKAVADWDGRAHLSPTDPALPSREDRPGARIALLAALAPHHLTAEDVRAWLAPPFSEHCLLHLVAFGAMAATERQAERAAAALH